MSRLGGDTGGFGTRQELLGKRLVGHGPRAEGAGRPAALPGAGAPP